MRGSSVVVALVCCVLAAFGARPASAQDSLEGDRRALATLVASSIAGLERCQLGLRASQSVAVQTFCRDTVPRREVLAWTGIRLAKRLGLTVPPLPPDGFADRLAELARTTGHAFDRDLILADIVDSEGDQDRLRYATAMAADPGVRAYEVYATAAVVTELNAAELALRRITAGGG